MSIRSTPADEEQYTTDLFEEIFDIARLTVDDIAMGMN